MHDDQQQFEAWCFLYACGKTDAVQTAWMDRMLAQHPHWQPLLAAEQALVQAGRAALATEQAVQPMLLSDADLLALADSVNRETGTETQTGGMPTPRRSASGWRARLLAWWQRPLQGGYAYGALAVLVLGISVQTYRIEQQTWPATAGVVQYRSMPAGAATAATARMRVLFHDEVNLGRLRAVLAALGLSIVHGPDQHGAYWLAASAADEAALAAVAKQLQASGLVVDVQVLPQNR